MSQPGEIVAEHASRRFKVYPRESRRLKDAVVARGRSRPTDVVALEDVSFRIEPGWLVVCVVALIAFEACHIELWRFSIRSLGVFGKASRNSGKRRRGKV